MSTAGDVRLSDVHLLIMGYFRCRGRGSAAEIAVALGLGVDLVVALLDESEAADMIERRRGR